MFCEEVFNGIKKKKDEGDAAEYEVGLELLFCYKWTRTCTEIPAFHFQNREVLARIHILSIFKYTF